jgi:hypothetical protein
MRCHSLSLSGGKPVPYERSESGGERDRREKGREYFTKRVVPKTKNSALNFTKPPSVFYITERKMRKENRDYIT